MMSRMTNTAPPGWYRDPNNPTIDHWWDGTAYNGSRAAGVVTPPLTNSQPVAVYQAAVPVSFVPVVLGAISPKSRTVATLLVGWLTFGIWPLVDWIIIVAGGAHDGQGLPVTNWD